jgi:hypothetical protein
VEEAKQLIASAAGEQYVVHVFDAQASGKVCENTDLHYSGIDFSIC